MTETIGEGAAVMEPPSVDDPGPSMNCAAPDDAFDIDAETIDLLTSPCHLLHRAQQFASERFAHELASEGVTQRQFAVLNAVARAQPLTQTALVRATGIDRSTLAELVARMADRGLLLRERASQDARANLVRLSPAGLDALRLGRAGAERADRAVLKALPKNRRDSFIDALVRIAHAIDGEAPAARGKREAAVKDVAKPAKKTAKKASGAKKTKKKSKK